MSIVHLTPNDFHITQSNDLANKIPKFSLVFFSSANCIYCKDVLPAFIDVSTRIKGCTFAIMDVDQAGMKIVKMSEHTKTPIAYVPLVIMYVKGIPLSVFDSDEENPLENSRRLEEFIIVNANAVREGKTTSGGSTSNKKNRICETSIGIAVCGPRGCRYMRESEAYNK